LRSPRTTAATSRSLSGSARLSRAPLRSRASLRFSPYPVRYGYQFASSDGGTLVRLLAAFELTGAAALAGRLAAPIVKRGVDANLATLRAILER
jgi:hypothetical protein